MKVLFVSAEVYPFSKVGGLGDVAGSLPVFLARQGIDVSVFTPAYGSIDTDRFQLQSSPYYFTIQIGQEIVECGLSRWISPEQPRLNIYFLEESKYFGSRGVYSDANGLVYQDNGKRFLLLSKAALEVCKVLNWIPDIIHCHDYHTALIPVYLKMHYANDIQFQQVRTLLTLHNVAYQGIVEMADRSLFDLPGELFYPGAPLEWYGNINFLKAGIEFADALSTVSPTHAFEIMSDEVLSAGMKNVIRGTGKKVQGILNGVDYQLWNPESDIYIAKSYSARRLRDKHYNKIALINDMGINPELTHKPVIGMVTRMVEQKGIAILLEAMERLLTMDLTMIILGTGEERYKRELLAFSKRFPDRLAIGFGYNNPLSHKIIAGADLFLMPSRFEPCGITQMLALKYGTLPIVHRTGGLADTVTCWSKTQGNGFLFENYNAGDLIKVVQEALSVFAEQKLWHHLMHNAMAADFSWEKSARDYILLYESLLKQ